MTAIRGRRLALFLAGVAVVLGTAPAAGANGAYPDGEAILLPADPASPEITLATNFGLIRSDDAGRTWQWGCEQQATAQGNLYSLGPPPTNRIYVLSLQGLASSEDDGCTWRLADGPFPSDYFPDPNDAQRVLAIATVFTSSSPHDVLVASTDGAKTFTTTLYTGPSSAVLGGVEIARTAPQTIFLTILAGGGGGASSIARSTDGGATWTTADLTASLGAVQDLRIITVDPANAQRVFLRAIGISGDRLAIVDMAGDSGTVSVRVPVEVGGPLTGLLNRADGSIVVSGRDASGKGIGFQSTDGGMTFRPWPSSGALPALRALAERNGRLYGAADDLGADGFALGISDDDGATWTPILKYSQVESTIACAAAQCLETCQYEVSLSLFSPAVCAGASPAGDDAGAALDAASGADVVAGDDASLDATVPSDASSTSAGSTGARGSRSGDTGAIEAGASSSATDGSPATPGSGGNASDGCSLGASGREASAVFGAPIAFGLLAAVRRRARARRAAR